MKKIVHVVGTGTIGEPLLGLFTDFRDKMGIDEVTFHKRTPLASDRAKLNHLIQRGARLAVDEDVRSEFEKLGHEVSFESREALERATVIVDCTPAGNENKEKFYENLSGPKGFLAQGSEFGFGKPYARGINDEVLVAGEDRFIQIVSCNTHNITTLIKTLTHQDGKYALKKGTFVCMRRSNDISQADGFVPAPNVGKHEDPNFGTHHARDAHHVFETLDLDLNLFSSAVKLNTQYMHSIWFNLEHAGGGQEAPARQPAGGGDRQALRQPDLQLRPRSWVLRAYPVADGGGDADPRRAAQARGLWFLLHAPGRQLAALLGGGDPLAHRSRLAERVQPPAAAPPLAVPGDLTAPIPRSAARTLCFEIPGGGSAL